MSSALTSVKNIASNIGGFFTSFLKALEVHENNMLMLVSLVILFIAVLYLFITYQVAIHKVNKLADYSMHVNHLGKVYSAEPYDAATFEKLLIKALDELGGHVSIVAAPYFYAKSLQNMLKVFPTYIEVLKLAKYVYDHEDTRNDAVHKTLVKYYGSDYKTSPKITFNVTLTVSKFRTETIQHSILVDLTKAQFVYRKNKSKVDSLLTVNKSK